MADLHVLHPKGKSRRAAPLTGTHADYRRSDYRYPRDQREAGIDDLEWEERLPPLRPWMFWLAVAGSWAIFAAAFWGLAAIL
ncbi:MAG: hypothetical protein V4527_10865 [Pseudomonadota bacterium]